ncbi:unnamed protein product, partial [Medioppia subpectinata]
IEANQYAKKLVGNWLPDDYSTTVDEDILNISFKPDIFQKQSFYFLQKHESVFVSAHTSSGKTLVAEYAIHLALKRGNRVIYTSPIKALSNQKFFDFKSRFENVGLITGDVQVNPEANCLIMTTEILRNMVYRNSDLLRTTEFVIFDEVHYINDCDRGVVWEESIIMLPKHICLVMLSATIPNSMEFSEWVGRTKERCIYVISTEKRAVPLEFVIYSDFEAYSIAGTKLEAEPTNFKNCLLPYSKKIKPGGRFRINDLGHFVTNRRLIPAIFFSFSKKLCEEYGRSLETLDLTNPMEKKKIDQFLVKAMCNLTDADRYLPQVCRMSEQVRKGIAVHHGSLLPFVKECIEILFSQNLVKILIATETFAMGVNMPAKCCVFLSLTKIDNSHYRYLETGEFIQMSGRAGRRGMDKVGTVIIADQRNPPLTTIKKVIDGHPLNLSSQFKLSFSLILMALRGNITVEDLMRSSFKEHEVQKGFSTDMIRLSSLETSQKLQCSNCEDEIRGIQGDYRSIVEYTINNEISFIKNKYSEKSLVQMEEYTARTKFLVEKGFVVDGTVTIKGRVAAEIRTVNDVFVTELVFGNFFEDLTFPETLALMSSMIYEEDTDGQDLNEEFISRFDEIKQAYTELQTDIDKLSIPCFQSLNFGMAQAVYDWANGIGLGPIVAKHSIQEGSFVRLILRLDECCREMVNVAILIGNADLERKFSESSSMIKRDIVFMPIPTL